MNALLQQMARDILVQKILEDLANSTCDLCNNLSDVDTLRKCGFCQKSFCVSCCGKNGTSICRTCNWSLANFVNLQNLNQFSISQLKVISDNYLISRAGILEKRDLIEGILKEFKKSIEGCKPNIVNVDTLRLKMEDMKCEERCHREHTLLKDKENSKLFCNYDCVQKKKEPLVINFNLEDHISVSVADIPSMSVKEIKSILDKSRIDYSTLIEKQELVELATNLTETYNKFREENIVVQPINPKGNGETKSKLECIVCLDKRINCVFINCAHSSCCYECGIDLLTCPICRKDIKECMKIYIG